MVGKSREIKESASKVFSLNNTIIGLHKGTSLIGVNTKASVCLEYVEVKILRRFYKFNQINSLEQKAQLRSYLNLDLVGGFLFRLMLIIE